MDTPPTQSLRYGDVVTLTAEKAAFEGHAIGRWNSFVVFIEGAVPGDTVSARIFKKKKHFAHARAIEILSPSPERVEPRCSHFGVCGGCTWQSLSYKEQLRWKREHVVDAYERIGGFRTLTVRETLPSPDVFHYRNKMEYSFGEKRWRYHDELSAATEDEPLFSLGLHVPGRFDKILHVDECHLQSPESNVVLGLARRFLLDAGLPAYSTKSHTGDLRHLVIREGKQTGERMVFLVTTHENAEVMHAFAEALRAEPAAGVTTFVQGLTDRKSLVAIGDRTIVHFGDGLIRERLGGNLFTISPSSFFQTNTLQAERLYAVAAEYAELQPADIAWDLYCGAGTIALFLASRIRGVLGVEVNPDAVHDARANAAANGVDNAVFECADIVDFLHRPQTGAIPAPDILVLDPPRAGLHPQVAEAVGRSGSGRLVYVSCNPGTSARDCAILAAHGYRIEEITPVDMFPHTYHIECVVKMRK
jgi:23S rRNA (uracil1939-C5)-methyltransferase